MVGFCDSCTYINSYMRAYVNESIKVCAGNFWNLRVRLGYGMAIRVGKRIVFIGNEKNVK